MTFAEKLYGKESILTTDACDTFNNRVSNFDFAAVLMGNHLSLNLKENSMKSFN